MSPMSQFGIQFNKNSFGLTAAAPLQIASLPPNQATSYSLSLVFSGAIQKMEPLDTLQIAVKNNQKVFYFATTIPMEALFTDDGKMERQVFLATWKDISPQNESTFNIEGKMRRMIYLYNDTNFLFRSRPTRKRRHLRQAGSSECVQRCKAKRRRTGHAL